VLSKKGEKKELDFFLVLLPQYVIRRLSNSVKI
jgi:hypothetical protein